MPDLLHTLQGHDLGFLKMLAGLWGIEVIEPDAPSALPALLRAIRQPELVQEIIDALPGSAQEALRDLIENGGCLAWPLFARRYGEVRALGAARRDRERPDHKPASPTEMLWYRGLIGQAFFNLPPEPQEYAFIPNDLLELIHLPAGGTPPPFGHPAPAPVTIHPHFSRDCILDHACTLLASLRLKMPVEGIPTSATGIPLQVLQKLLFTAKLLDAKQMPQPERVRVFLEASRGEALGHLTTAWIHSTTFNELHLLPGLVCEGEWVNDPLLARTALLEMLSNLPENTWWSIDAFVSDVRKRRPDFQRPAGDYDSWFIRRAGSKDYLRGFTAWDEVDGALIRYLISGPLFWLGFLDLAAPDPESTPKAFRLSSWWQDLRVGKPPTGLPLETERVRVTTEGRINVPRLAPRSLRYQVARFTDWLAIEKEEYPYILSPDALERARRQGLHSNHLIHLLRKHSANQVPPSIIQFLDRWERYGVQAKIESVRLLRVSSPEVLAALRKTRAARYLDEQLTAVVVSLKPGSAEHVLRALAEIGYLGEIVEI